MALRTLSDRLSDGVPFQQLVSESDFLFDQFDGGVAFYDPQHQFIAGAPSNDVWAQRPFAQELLDFLGDGSGPAFSPLVTDAPTRGVVLFIAIPSARRNCHCDRRAQPAATRHPHARERLAGHPARCRVFG